MAVTILEIMNILMEAEVAYRSSPKSKDAVLMVYGTETFVDYETGDKDLHVLVKVTNEGHGIKIEAPKAFSLADAKYPDEALRALMMHQWRTLFIQYEYDESDGEIRPLVEFPVMDAVVTKDQLLSSIACVVGLVDKIYPVFVKAKDEGVIDFSLIESSPEVPNEL